MEKTDSISPLGEQKLVARICVTVRLPCNHPLPPSWAVLYSVRQEGGRGSVCGSGGYGKPTGTPQHALAPKHDHSHKPGARNGCSSTPCPKRMCIILLHATNRQGREAQHNQDRPRTTTHHHIPKRTRTRTQPTATIPVSDDDEKKKGRSWSLT